MGQRILVAMSGGVDSAVTAALLREAGFEVIGARMQVMPALPADSADRSQACCAMPDERDARAVAERLGVPFHAFDLVGEFQQRVVEPFVREYLAGRTPNPCVRCNPTMKLGLLFEKGRALGCTALATGHYVRVEKAPGGARWGLRRARDRSRDQSYYLCRLTQEQLGRFRAPLGEWSKDQVRSKARELRLPIASKHDSQEVCFLPDNDYRRFVREHPLARRRRIEPGDIVDREGRVLGRHAGIVNYTIGQRRGLGIAHARPLYVVALDPAANRVIVGEKSETVARGLVAGDVNWVAMSPPPRPLAARVQIRYRHAAAPARVEPLGADRIRVLFDRPQPAVTPGQAAVLYSEENEWLLAGGWIERAEL